MKRFILNVVAVLGASAAHAEGSVGVVVSGDATLQAPMSSALGGWLQQHGHPVTPTPLPPAAVNRLVDCFVLEDTTCARRVIEQDASSDAIVFARIESVPAGQGKNVTIAAYWLRKGHAPATQRTECQQCSDDALRITTDAMLFALASAAKSAPVASAPSPVALDGAAAGAAPAASAAAVAPPPETAGEDRPTGLGVGLELGDPSSATVAWLAGDLALSGAIGDGTRTGFGLSLYAEAQLVVHRLAPAIPVRVGFGARYYHHGYQPASVDEVPDSHYGLRASIAVAHESRSLQLYAELAPGIDVKRTRSCTLADGPQSICPHAQEGPLFLQFMIGARWFFFH